jgi:hypothetical protein
MMASFSARRVFAAAGSMAAMLSVPAIAVLAGPAPSAVAQCGGGINIGILNEGVPVTGNCPAPLAPGSAGGAPSQDLLTACSNIPGCLSNALYGPGIVQVPQRSNRVQQSQ